MVNIKYIIKAKREKRLARTLKVMKAFGDKYKCSDCFHGQIQACSICPLPNGCEEYFNADNNVFGIKYEDRKKIALFC